MSLIRTVLADMGLSSFSRVLVLASFDMEKHRPPYNDEVVRLFPCASRRLADDMICSAGSHLLRDDLPGEKEATRSSRKWMHDEAV